MKLSYWPVDVATILINVGLCYGSSHLTIGCRMNGRKWKDLPKSVSLKGEKNSENAGAYRLLDYY